MRIEILGPLRVVTDDGTDITPRGMQQRRALAALAASPDGISIDVLEDLLWPSGAPSANALQALISKLRKVIAPATVEADRRSYVLTGAATDRHDLERAVAARSWDRVETLASGRPLDDLDDHELAAPLRASVASALRTARRDRIDRAVAEAPESVIAELETMVADDPFDESWWARLMLAHARCGRSAEALRTFQRARAVLANELGLEPGPELRRLEADVLSGGVPLSSTSGVTTSSASAATPPEAGPAGTRWQLPSRVGSFVGRATELTELTDAIGRHRLVTIVGPGGAGKTTTTLELAHRLGRETAFAQLADVDDHAGVIRRIARAIGLPDNEAPGMALPSDTADRIRAALSNRRSVLVLDNCEHLIADVARIAHELLTACSGLAVIATSRASLGIAGEHLFPLPPLPPVDAVELFAHRAADHGVAIDRTDPAVRALCERLDGLPLAIELAAARIRSMTVAELDAGLDDRFALLDAGPRTAEHRQQTLRAVVDWSHDLLSDAERIVFRRLAAFVGGAGAAGVRAVCSGAADGLVVADTDVPRLIDALVDQSLVRVDRSGPELRFSMLQTLVDYAAERLRESGEQASVAVRHAQFVADDLGPALRGLIGHEQPRWFAKVAAERGNLNVALDTALAIGEAQLALELVVPVGWYFFMAGELQGGADLLEAALSLDGPTEPTHRALALAMYGWLLSNGPDLERASAVSTEALSMLERTEDPFTRGLIVNAHVMALIFAGDLDAVAKALPLLHDVGARSADRWVRAMTRVVLGEFAQFQGAVDEAERLFAESAAEFEAVGDRFAYALTITESSELAEVVGDYDRAVELLTRGIALAAEVGFSGHPLAMRARLGNVEILRGDLDAAERHHAALVSDAITSGVPWLQTMAHLGLSAVARRRRDFGLAEQHLDAAWALPRSRAVPYMRSIIEVARGYLADQRGDAAGALAFQRDGLDIAVQLGSPRVIAYSFEGVAGALALSDDESRQRLAAQLLGRADALRRASGGPMPAGERYDVDRAERRLRRALGDAVVDQELSAGATLDVDGLVTRIGEIATDGAST